MHLLHLMHDVPLWVTALLLTVGAAVYSIGLMLMARRAYGVDRLKLSNEVAGFKFAVIGVFYAVMLAFVVIVLLIVKIEPIWWALVLLTSGGVLAAELFNTALEHLADHLHPETHPRIQIVKDCAAAAVLVTAGAASAVGIALFVHLMQRQA